MIARAAGWVALLSMLGLVAPACNVRQEATPDASVDAGGEAGPQDIVLNVDYDMHTSNTDPRSFRNALIMALNEETDGGVIEVNGSRIKSITVKLREFRCTDDAGMADVPKAQANVRDLIVPNAATIAFMGSACGSPPTQAVLPLTSAVGLLQISYAAYSGLTLPTSVPDEPDVYYPTGIRNFARVNLPDLYGGKAGDKFMKSISGAGDGGTPKVYLIHMSAQPDQGVIEAARANLAAYGLAPAIQSASGIRIIPAGITTTAADLVADDVLATGADWVYIGTSGMPGLSAVTAVIKQIHAKPELENVKILVTTNTYFQTGFLPGLTVANTANLYAVKSGLDPAAYTGAALTWWNNYKETYPTDTVHLYTAHFYDAMKVLMKALKSLGDEADSRDAVRRKVLSTTNYSGVLGTWSFDGNGDITVGHYSGYAANGTTTWRFVEAVTP